MIPIVDAKIDYGEHEFEVYSEKDLKIIRMSETGCVSIEEVRCIRFRSSNTSAWVSAFREIGVSFKS